jgi:two-component system, cell cycle response regulator DivK
MPNDKMILIVEDNADNRTLIKDVLDALDFGVLEATDGNEGVELALKHKPALILMDLSLPHKDGWEATREIKANADTANTPIIALTAHAMVGDRERALEAGCDDYISKPINLMELNEKIRKHLADKPAIEDTKAKDESPAKPSSPV